MALGRPEEYTPEIGDKIVELVRNGYPRKDIAGLLHVNKETVIRWIQRHLADRIHEAEAQRIGTALTTINTNLTDPKYAWKLLATLRPEEYGDRQRIAIENADGKAFETRSINIDFGKLNTAEIQNIRESLNKAIVAEDEATKAAAEETAE
jgi:hypothetical protein